MQRPEPESKVGRAIFAAVADSGRTIVQSARDHGQSWPAVAAVFTAHAAAVLPAEPEPAVLAMTSLPGKTGRAPGTGLWKITVDRWHVAFVDVTGGRGLLGQVEGRTAQAVTEWANDRPADWRAAVSHVVIDTCSVSTVAVTIALPHARGWWSTTFVWCSRREPSPRHSRRHGRRAG